MKRTVNRLFSTTLTAPKKVSNRILWGWAILFFLALCAPLLPFNNQELDLAAGTMAPPFTTTAHGMHWLGTDAVGRDVLGAMLYGIYNALWVGLLSAAIAGVIGFAIGIAAGLWSNTARGITLPGLILGIMALLLGWYQGTLLSDILLPDGSSSLPLWFLAKLAIVAVPLIYLGFSQWITGLLRKRIRLPQLFKWRPGRLLIVITDVVRTIPSIYLLLALLTIASLKGVFAVAFIIGVTTWPQVALAIQAETLAVNAGGYSQTARALGYEKIRIILREILPNVWPVGLSVMVACMGSAILAESYLAFLGISPVSTATWGSLIADSRAAGGWWLALFPGLFLYGLLWLVYNSIPGMGAYKR